jgi:hypothetical protein
MSDYRKMGHAMRRRAGAASNHMDGAGKKTSVDVPSVIEQHITAGSARLSVGAVRGTLIPKKNTQAGDPTVMGPKPRRTPVQVDASSSERLGAAYRVKSRYSVSSPEAGATMANGRVVPSTMGSRQNFSSGSSDSMV